MLEFSLTTWTDSKDAMEWLFPLHWEEVAHNKDQIKLDVWYEGYDELEKSGQFHIVVAKDGQQVVGYHWSIVRPHLHYKQSLTAYTDIYFLHPEYRKGMNGVNLFKFVEKTLKERGVQRMYSASKVHQDKSKIFDFLGWTHCETTYSKMVE